MGTVFREPDGRSGVDQWGDIVMAREYFEVSMLVLLGWQQRKRTGQVGIQRCCAELLPCPVTRDWDGAFPLRKDCYLRISSVLICSELFVRLEAVPLSSVVATVAHFWCRPKELDNSKSSFIMDHPSIHTIRRAATFRLRS